MHGGDIYRNKVELDFSINVNPLEPTAGVKSALLGAADKCGVYPDLQQEELKKAIAGLTGADAQNIICGNGASELFVAIVHALRPGKVLIPAPSFSGYERAAKAAFVDVVYHEMSKESGFVMGEDICRSITDDIDLLFLANPNNPTGAMMPPELLEKILGICVKKHVAVILDEAFIEFSCEAEKRSFINRTGEYPGLIVVRAFTKFYAMPGVRLGYLAASDEELKNAIIAQLPEWNVSVFAQEAGIAAIRENESYLGAARALKNEREYMIKALSDMGFEISCSDVNFLLFHSEVPLHDKLLEQGIMIRDCSDYRGLKEGYYRVAVRFHKDNEKLIEAIRSIINDR